jgi:putative YhdH/YhfP family quinone oxidoreductase
MHRPADATTFRALWVEENPDGGFTRRLALRRIADLPPGEVLVAVHYSSLNYKDLLSAEGNRGVTRQYPHTPGIDAAGIVVHSSDAGVKAGDPVIVTSHDLGMNTPGGFGQFIRVPASWIVPLPPGLSLRESMAYGTAGLTAALSVGALLDNGVTPDRGEILVSGATGGLGSLAVAILSRIGFRVAAVGGRGDGAAFLKAIGAHRVVSLTEAAAGEDRALLQARWAGGVDAVGGAVLAATLKSMRPYGVVTCCGNAASADLPINVYPFILRGVRLIGIDSQNCPMPLRRGAWEKLGGPWKLERLDMLAREISLDDLAAQMEKMRAGGRRGRILVRLKD